tara:strand:+ start:19 stop:243 length:225 start_codon:yes stop_codon:yes gene_type:complete
MNLLSATNTHFKALLEKYAFQINRQVQNLKDEDGVEKLSKYILKYNEARQAIETISVISQQLSESKEQEVKDES